MNRAGHLAGSLSVDHPHFQDSPLTTEPQVFGDQFTQFRRPKRMQVKFAGDGQFNGLF